MNDTPINLNKARKARAKVDAKRTADQNAVRFGRSKADKETDRAIIEKDNRDLDGAKRDP